MRARQIAEAHQEFADDFAAVLDPPQTPARLATIAAAQARYRGAEALAEHYGRDA